MTCWILERLNNEYVAIYCGAKQIETSPRGAGFGVQ
jgi:hypothetical protein